ncbi:MAG TPA: ABC transporter substrate-binding protein [Blastocatellia bacterium]|nr:ABC transporter substrate-binding protein [Blastocatellia bacterium]
MGEKIWQLEICIFSFMLFLASLTRAEAGAPLDLVRTTVDRAIQILKDPELSSRDKKKERMDRLREAIDPVFDYEEMAKRALGPPLAEEDRGGAGGVCQAIPRFLGKSLLG